MTRPLRSFATKKRTLLVGSAVLVLALFAAEVAVRSLDVFDPPAFEDNAAYGYLMRPNQSVSTRGIRFRINNIGFRGEDVPPRKPVGVTRIAFVGDSITYGGGTIPDDELFVNRTASGLSTSRRSRFEGLNLSAPGWGVQNMVAYLSAHGVHEADWIVWVLSTVDFRRPKTTREENGFWSSKPWSRFAYGITAMLHKSNLPMRADSAGTGRLQRESGVDIRIATSPCFERACVRRHVSASVTPW